MTRKQLTDIEKDQILAWNSSGDSLQTIDERLEQSPQTMSDFIKKYDSTNSTSRRSGSGRPRATTAREDRFILIQQNRDLGISSPNIKRKLGLQISDKTIRNRLHKKDLKSYWSTKKAFVNK